MDRNAVAAITDASRHTPLLRLMVRRFKESLNSGVPSSLKDAGEITAKMINDAALQGDKASLDVIKETGHYLGVALVNIMHILNPEVIVLTGGMIGSEIY